MGTFLCMVFRFSLSCHARFKTCNHFFFNLTHTILISLKFSLHKVAADLAFEATYLFLSDIRSTVGDDIFAKFLNLNSDESMALVIDVSGSMSGESFELCE